MRLTGFVLTAIPLVLFGTSPSWAQTSGGGSNAARKWEVEVHGGTELVTNPRGGTGALPPTSTPFRTIGLGRSSRRVSSWYFGDGAVLLNDVNAVFRAAQSITPLDPVLQSASTERGSGGNVGFRLARRLSERFEAELNVDYGFAQLSFTDAALSGIESSRTSFTAAFSRLVATGAFTGPLVTSVSTIDEGNARQVQTTGAVVVNLRRGHSLVPYVTAGAGVLSNVGNGPNATLVGNYRFSFQSLFPLNETDTVTLRIVRDGNAFVGLFGGGIKYAPSGSRWGVRLDVRANLSRVTTRTTIDANPSVVTATPGFALASNTEPSIQFSSSTLIPSSLSGAPIAGFTTFAGSGMVTSTNVTAGLLFRF